MITANWWKTHHELMAETHPNTSLKIPAGEEVQETLRGDDGKSIIYWNGYQKGASGLTVVTDTLASSADPLE